MSARAARFEVVHTGPRQFHARFRAANGQVVWTTESYTRRRAAMAAVASMVDPFLGCWIAQHSGQIEYRYDSWNKVDRVLLEVREVDEREVTP